MVALILTILKWLGIILLILLAVVIVILLIILLVPIHYRISAGISDPETHDSFPAENLIRGANVSANISWLLRLLCVNASYPKGELLDVQILGRKLDVMRFLKRSEEAQEEPQEEKKEEPEKKDLDDQIEELIDKVDRLCTKIDYYWRILTGSCGRRATDKVLGRLLHILKAVLPADWSVTGTLGLGDPYRSGKIAQITSVLYPVTEEHLQLNTEWEYYRCDLAADFTGRLRLGVFVTQLVPLLFDKDCRKVYSKFKKARAKLAE